MLVELKLQHNYRTEHIEVKKDTLIFHNCGSSAFLKFDFPSSVVNKLLTDFDKFYRVAIVKGSHLNVGDAFHLWQQLPWDHWKAKLKDESFHDIDKLSKLMSEDSIVWMMSKNNPEVCEMIAIYLLSKYKIE